MLVLQSQSPMSGLMLFAEEERSYLYDMISHEMYQKSCVKRSHARNIAWRAFNVSIWLITKEDDGLV